MVFPRSAAYRAASLQLLFAAVWAVPVTQAQTSGPPVRSLGPVVATSTITFSAVSQLVGLSDGRVLVSDGTRRQLQLLDASLSHPLVVLDSAAGKQNSFTSQSFLTTFRGDSALFFDYAAKAFVVIEPNGTLGRVMAPPYRGPMVPFPINSSRPASSLMLGLEYGAFAPRPVSTRPAPGEPDIEVHWDDSVFVMRMDFTTRSLDTLAKISIGFHEIAVISATPGPTRLSSGPAIFPFYDAPVVTTDGSIAIFHAHEYRIEWIGPDGVQGPGPKPSYPWRRISDEERQHALDSVQTARQHAYDSTVAVRSADSIRTGAGPTTRIVTVTADGERTERQAPRSAPPLPIFPSAQDIPDFHPPTGRAAIWADGNNNVWIRPIPLSPVVGFAIWDVINRAGELADRVRIPDDRTIVGFGRDVVYLAAHNAGVITIEKVRVR